MFRHFFEVLMETPADGGGGAATATPPALAAQPPVGQGQGAEAFWGMFPNIPQEHRPLLEPHLKQVQGHVTRLEQQLASLKPVLDAGLDPQSAAGLVQFSRDFDANPLDMWVKIGRMLQDQNVVDADVDLDYLAAIASGEDPDATANGTAPVSGQVPGQEPTGDPQTQQLLSTIQQLQAKVEQLEQGTQQDKAQRMQAVQDQLLNRRIAAMKDTLVKSGWPEDILTEQELVSKIIVFKGDVEAATKALVDQRSGILKGFTDNRNPPDDLNLPNGAPPTTPRSNIRNREKNDPWAKARQGAQSTLMRQNRASAQE